MLPLPLGFEDKGESIHTSPGDMMPHLTGSFGGKAKHIRYYGQTTLGMFDRSLPGHRLSELDSLHEQFPALFKDSGLKW
jgi:hypothetical protein